MSLSAIGVGVETDVHLKQVQRQHQQELGDRRQGQQDPSGLHEDIPRQFPLPVGVAWLDRPFQEVCGVGLHVLQVVRPCLRGKVRNLKLGTSALKLGSRLACGCISFQFQVSGFRPWPFSAPSYPTNKPPLGPAVSSLINLPDASL